MQLPFFFEDIQSDIGEEFEVSEETSKHLIQVLRRKVGDAVVITNGKGLELTVQLVNEDRKRTKVRVVEREMHHLPKVQNGIAVAVLKNTKRFEWFLEKATELGIKKIYPMMTQRTEKKSLRMDRMQMTMINALIQSRQFFLPEFTVPKTLDDLLASLDADQKFIAHCVDSDEKQPLEGLINGQLSNVVLIGPEGDFTEDEIALCLSDGYRPVSLGDTRLRTETAALKAAVYLS